jgi:hypothetical protein
MNVSRAKILQWAAFFYSLSVIFSYNSIIKISFQFISLGICSMILYRVTPRYYRVELFFTFLTIIGYLSYTGFGFHLRLFNFLLPILFVGITQTPQDEDRLVKGLVIPYLPVIPLVILQYFNIGWAWDIRALVPTPTGDVEVMTQMYGSRPFGLSYYSITLSYQLAIILPLLFTKARFQLLSAIFTGTKSLILGVFVYASYLWGKKHRLGGLTIILRILIIGGVGALSLVGLHLAWDLLDFSHQKSFAGRILIYGHYLNLPLLDWVPDYLVEFTKQMPTGDHQSPHIYFVTLFLVSTMAGIIGLLTAVWTLFGISRRNPYWPPILIFYINSFFHNGGLINGFHMMLLVSLLALRWDKKHSFSRIRYGAFS